MHVQWSQLEILHASGELMRRSPVFLLLSHPPCTLQTSKFFGCCCLLILTSVHWAFLPSPSPRWTWKQRLKMCRSGFNLPSHSEAIKRKSRAPAGGQGALGVAWGPIGNSRPAFYALKPQMAEARMTFRKEVRSFWWCPSRFPGRSKGTQECCILDSVSLAWALMAMGGPGAKGRVSRSGQQAWCDLKGKWGKLSNDSVQKAGPSCGWSRPNLTRSWSCSPPGPGGRAQRWVLRAVNSMEYVIMEQARATVVGGLAHEEQEDWVGGQGVKVPSSTKNPDRTLICKEQSAGSEKRSMCQGAANPRGPGPLTFPHLRRGVHSRPAQSLSSLHYRDPSDWESFKKWKQRSNPFLSLSSWCP